MLPWARRLDQVLAHGFCLKSGCLFSYQESPFFHFCGKVLLSRAHHSELSLRDQGHASLLQCCLPLHNFMFTQMLYPNWANPPSLVWTTMIKSLKLSGSWTRGSAHQIMEVGDSNIKVRAGWVKACCVTCAWHLFAVLLHNESHEGQSGDLWPYC